MAKHPKYPCQCDCGNPATEFISSGGDPPRLQLCKRCYQTLRHYMYVKERQVNGAKKFGNKLMVIIDRDSVKQTADFVFRRIKPFCGVTISPFLIEAALYTVIFNSHDPTYAEDE